jgi:hypothetical protein
LPSGFLHVKIQFPQIPYRAVVIRKKMNSFFYRIELKKLAVFIQQIFIPINAYTVYWTAYGDFHSLAISPEAWFIGPALSKPLPMIRQGSLNCLRALVGGNSLPSTTFPVTFMYRHGFLFFMTFPSWIYFSPVLFP